MKGTVTFASGRTDTFTVDERCVAYDREMLRWSFAHHYAVIYGEPMPVVLFDGEMKPPEPPDGSPPAPLHPAPKSGRMGHPGATPAPSHGGRSKRATHSSREVAQLG